MPLPLTASCFSKIQIGFTFLVPAHPGSPGQSGVKRVHVLENTGNNTVNKHQQLYYCITVIIQMTSTYSPKQVYVSLIGSKIPEIWMLPHCSIYTVNNGSQ